MISLLRQNISGATLLQLGADLSCLFFAVILAIRLHGYHTSPFGSVAALALAFAVLMVCLNGALGLYRRDRNLPFAAHVGWIFFALLLGVPLAYLLALLLPNGQIFQETLGAALVIAFGGLVVVRHAIVRPFIETLLPHRVLVLGTGPEARVVEARRPLRALRAATTRPTRSRRTAEEPSREHPSCVVASAFLCSIFRQFDDHRLFVVHFDLGFAPHRSGDRFRENIRQDGVGNLERHHRDAVAVAQEGHVAHAVE